MCLPWVEVISAADSAQPPGGARAAHSHLRGIGISLGFPPASVQGSTNIITSILVCSQGFRGTAGVEIKIYKPACRNQKNPG